MFYIENERKRAKLKIQYYETLMDKKYLPDSMVVDLVMKIII